jgi:hypothetical protein
MSLTPDERMATWAKVRWSTAPPTALHATTVEMAEHGSTAGSFRALVANGAGNLTYWVKPLSGPEGPVATIAEMIVSRLGVLIGAAVCEGHLIDVSVAADTKPSAAADYHELAFATRELSAVVTDSPMVRFYQKDINRNRFASFLGLYQWCLGGDPQWFYIGRGEFRAVGHDFGRYFLPREDWRRQDRPHWDSDSLTASVGVRRTHPVLEKHADPKAARDVANRILAVDHQALVGILDPIVAAWGAIQPSPFKQVSVTDTMRVMGWFLESRRELVAEQLIKLADRAL